MTYSDNDTIYGLSSGALPAGVAVVRISGNRSRFALETICKDVQFDRNPRLKSIYNPKNGTIIDRGLVLCFPSPSSFTGEDVVEIHCHGSVSVVECLFNIFSQMDGVRLAEAGEFTRRAFYNNKMDLIAVEGLSDLISAETEMQHRLAQNQVSGSVGETFAVWRRKLIDARALIEAELDFPDEDDVPGSVSESVWKDVLALIGEMEEAQKGQNSAERVRNGLSVVIAGLPNVGKSSLMNALSKRDVSIVTDIAGTTRDSLDVHMNIKGLPVILTDTAGIRATDDQVEAIGVIRAQSKIKNADIVVLLEDLTPLDHESQYEDDLTTYGVDRDEELSIMKVGSKIDLLDEADLKTIRNQYDYIVSAETGHGLNDLCEGIFDLGKHKIGDIESLCVLRSRHSEIVSDCILALKASCDERLSLELRAEQLRIASDLLGRISGRTDIEDVLDRVFSEFCIGK